jgi:hypothetical protein
LRCSVAQLEKNKKARCTTELQRNKKNEESSLRRCSVARKNKRGRLAALERRKKKEKKVGCVVALQRSVAKKTKEGWLRCSAAKKNEEG